MKAFLKGKRVQENNNQRKWRLSLPIKVVVFTGLAYIFAWFFLSYLPFKSNANLNASFLGVQLKHWAWFAQVLFVTTVAYLSSYYLLDLPLQRLHKVLAQVKQGSLEVRAPILTEDEMGNISQEFNSLIGKLAQMSDPSIQLHEALQAKTQAELIQDENLEKQELALNHQRLQVLVKDLSLIYEVGQKVSSVIDLDKLYQHIASTLERYLDFDYFTLVSAFESEDVLKVYAAHGFDKKSNILEQTFPKGEGIPGEVMLTGKKVYIRDINDENRFLYYPDESKQILGSFLSLPLICKQEVLGVLNFGRERAGGFTSGEVKKLSLIASQIALSVANAKLYTKTRELSVKDELTGVYNRRHFQRMLKMEWKRAVRFRRDLSVVMIDADHFKEYNDTFGHLQGDQVLKGLGDLFTQNLREVDTVARFGGEEFILLLPDTDKHGAIAVAEKIRKLVENEQFFDGDKETRQVTVSLGIATYPDDVGAKDDLIDHADIALYRSKERGRNQVTCFSPAIPKTREQLEEVQVAEESEAKKPNTRTLQ